MPVTKSLDEVKYITVGFIRSDGSMEVLSTFNNGADQIEQTSFIALVLAALTIYRTEHEDAEAYERQDCIDVLDLEQHAPTFDQEWNDFLIEGYIEGKPLHLY